MGSWILLFPATYLAHIAEEYWGGFAARTAELAGLAVPEAAFLAANAASSPARCSGFPSGSQRWRADINCSPRAGFALVCSSGWLRTSSYRLSALVLF